MLNLERLKNVIIASIDGVLAENSIIIKIFFLIFLIVF